MDIKKKVLTLAVLSTFSVSAMANTPTNEEIYANDERNERRNGRA